MFSRSLCLILPVLALFAIGSAAAAPNILAKWQELGWSRPGNDRVAALPMLVARVLAETHRR